MANGIGDQRLPETPEEKRRRIKAQRAVPAQVRRVRPQDVQAGIVDPDVITNPATAQAMSSEERRTLRAIGQAKRTGPVNVRQQEEIAGRVRAGTAGRDIDPRFTEPGGDIPTGVSEVTTLGGRPRSELAAGEIFTGVGDEGEVAFSDRANIGTLIGGRAADLPAGARGEVSNVPEPGRTGPFGRTAAEQQAISERVAGIEAQTAALRGQRETQERGGLTESQARVRDLEQQANQRISLRQGLSGFLNQTRQANQARRSLRDLRSEQAAEGKEARTAAREDAREARKTQLELIKLGRQGTQAARERVNEITDATFDKDVKEVGLQEAAENLVVAQGAAGIQFDPNDSRVAIGFQQIKDKLLTKIDEEAAGFPIVTALLDVFRGTESVTSRGERGRLDFGNMRVETDGGEKYAVLKGDKQRGTRDTRVPLSEFDDDPAFRDTIERLLGGSRGG